MEPQRVKPWIVTAIVLILVVPIVLAGGLLTRSYVHQAFTSAERVRAARQLAFNALKLQLDEETGIRGFAATRDADFLQPYREARAAREPALRKLADALRALAVPGTLGPLDDAVATSGAWENEVARPLTAAHPVSPLVIQRRGKQLMDRFRGDVGSLDALLAQREAALDVGSSGAIDRVGGFALAAVLVLIAVGIAYGVQQSLLAERLGDEQRSLARLRAAYEIEKRIADTLQEAFLQRSLPALPSVRFSATYVPAAEEANVGGDWYDVVELTRERVLFVIGDVAGHGLDAAVAMNRARQAIVSAAALDPDPALVLAQVNRELLLSGARMVTALCGVADSRSYEFTYATAGHPPPVLIEPGREPRMLDCGGLPLAVDAGAAYRTATVQTVPGATLLLYTDGAVEHSHDVLAGEQSLLAAAAGAIAGDASNVAAAIHATIFEQRAVADDVAILTVTFAGGGVRDVPRCAA